MSTRGDPSIAAPRTTRTLLFVVSEDWYFLSHRLPMATAARDAGFDVHVATRVVDGAARIRDLGFTLHPVPFERGRLSPVATLRTVLALRRTYRAVAPQIVHHVSLQPTILGLTAALGLPVSCVNALTGLGYSFTSRSGKARLIRPLLRTLLRGLLARDRMVSLVQNVDDHTALVALGVPPGRIRMIAGSGVDTIRLRPLAEPDGPVTVGFVGRLLRDKGIHTLLAAHRLLRERGSTVRMLIAGEPDSANPASVALEEARVWNSESGVRWLGHVADISDVWAQAHIAVLPSYGEGLPLSLLEAAACGRPMIATDVAGCREIAVRDKTGLLVPVDDARALAMAIEKLAESPGLRASYGAAARERVETRFASRIIGEQTVAMYRELLQIAG
jgi:glycosyltransferase involved in cell wall biosynthesis